MKFEQAIEEINLNMQNQNVYFRLDVTYEIFLELVDDDIYLRLIE